MADLRTLGATSNRVRFTLKDKTTGQGKTGLSISTTGLIISTIADNEASATAYTVAGSTIETIATLGTFATPTSSKCRFKAVDATNHPGLYEFQFANARFAVTGAKRLVISVNDAESTILDGDYEIEFTNDLVASVWDEINTGATHNLANSTGKQVRSITSGTTDAIYPLSGTVNLTAATSTTATLDALASNGSQAYQWAVLNILTGTGAGQSRPITNYTTGRVATVSPAWTTTPDTSSTFDITPTASVQVLSYVAGQDPATLVWAAATRTITGFTAAALAQFFTLDTTKLYADAIAGSVVKETASNAGGGGGTVDANIVSSAINVPAILADGVAHGGTPGSSTATLALQKVNVTNPSGDAVILNGSTWGLSVSGTNNGGATFVGTGGSAFGVLIEGGPGDSAAALGIFALATNGYGVYIEGSGNLPGLLIDASGTAPSLQINGPSTSGPAVQITTTAGHGISVLAAGAGKKALLLAGDAATDSLAIAAGSGSPIDVFDAQARVTGSATLLDATPITDPGGVASTFPQMLVQVWRRFFKRTIKETTGHTIKTYADDGTTVRTSQPYTDDGAGNQTQGPAT